MIRRRLMMLKKSSGGLPEGYTAVDYIQTSGSQRIDTGVKSSASVGLSADFCFVDARTNQDLAQAEKVIREKDRQINSLQSLVHQLNDENEQLMRL